MHSLYFVILDNKGIEDSSHAKDKVLQILEKEKFCDCDAFFQSGKADWFLIGGRWTGILDSVLNKKQEETKPSNNFKGSENEAKILDKKLFRALKKKFQEVEIFDVEQRTELTFKSLEKEYALGRWIVVIDYHY